MSKICKTCDNDKFEYNDGFYYCTVCATKTHVFKLIRSINLH
jgi:uncharacterized Zn finger protein (UPF0148 family)